MFGRTSIVSAATRLRLANQRTPVALRQSKDDHEAEIPMRSFAYLCGSAAAFLMAACGRRVG
jgi:hypothetical protein